MEIPKLPFDEVTFIASLSRPQAEARMRALWEIGWSLQSIGSSLNPPRPKTTIHFWVKRAPSEQQHRMVPPPPPRSLTTSVPTKTAPRVRTISPGVPEHLKNEIKELSSQARFFRAKTPAGHPVALANDQLTTMVKTLYTMGVPAQALADAAGISYRAMIRRITK
jgi:hypothetical protein